MPISFTCPGCRRPYQVQDQMAGQGVKCACGSQFVVPRPQAAMAGGGAAHAAPPQDDWLGQELLAHQQKQAEAAAVAAERERAKNPYASPGMAGMHGMGQYGAPSIGGLWREGQLLVMDRNAQLPNICVKSGQPAARYLARKLTWQPQWLRMMQVIFGGLVYVILVSIYGKKATIQICLSEEYFKQRMMFLLIGWIGSLVGIAIGGGLLALGIQGDQAGLAIPGILIASVVPLVCGLLGYYGARMVWADLITERHVWVGGVSEAFLQHLPPWTGGRPR